MVRKARSGKNQGTSTQPREFELLPRVRGQRLKPQELLLLVDVAYGKELPSRIRYNRACFYTTAATKAAGDERETYDRKALAELDAGLASPTLVAWARKDPSLASLRSRERARFNEILRTHSVPGSEPPPPAGGQLAGITIIGDRFAAALAHAGIQSPEDLVEGTGSAAEREAVARRVGVPPDLVERWRGIAGLMVALEGVSTTFANLLSVSGVESRGALRRWQGKAVELRDLLGSLSHVAGVKRTPSLREVETWIRTVAG